MATTSAGARPLPALRAVRRFWNTPRRLVAIGAALALLAVGLGALVGGIDIGTAPGQSDYAFNQFDSSRWR